MEMKEINPSAVQSYFNNYFKLLASFACDKAKEYAEKEKQAQLPTPVQVALVNLAQNEKLYYSLVFLEQKSWFGRRDSLRNAYTSLQTSLLTIQRHEYSDDSSTEHQSNISNLISTICLQLSDFCTARIACINVYMQILKTLLIGSHDQLLKEIQNLINSNEGKFSSEGIEPLQESFTDELKTLLALFQANHEISSWEYVRAIHCIQDASSVLSKWKPMLAKNQGSSTFRSGFFGFGEKVNPNPTSALSNWMEKFFHALVSKFTFYFYESLSSTVTPEEMKSALGKTSYDFITKSLSFIRKNDVKNITIFLNTRGMVACPHHGYTFPDTSLNPAVATPVADITAVLSLPPSTCGDGSLSRSVLRDREDDLLQEKAVFCQSLDKKYSCFAVQIDVKLYLVVTFNGQKHEKDTNVSSYLTEIMQHLKIKRIALSIKPGSK